MYFFIIQFDTQDVMVPWHLQPKYIPGASQTKVSSEQATKTKQDDQKLRQKRRQKKEWKKQQKVKSHSRDSTSEHTYTDESICQQQVLTDNNDDDATNDVACLLSELPTLDLSDEELESEAGKIVTETKTSVQIWTNAPTIPDTTNVQVDTTEAISGRYNPINNSNHKTLQKETEHSHKSPALADGIHDTNKHGLREQGYQTFQRYYHVFRHGELVQLFSKTDRLQVIEEFFDHENWCVIAKKD